MPKKRYYTCPKCQQRVDGERYPKSGPCPFCHPHAEQAEAEGANREYRGSKRANLEHLGVFVQDRQSNKGETTIAIGPYARTIAIMLLLIGMLYYAAPVLYDMRAKPVYEKALYVADQASWFKTLATEPSIVRAEWKEGVLAVASAKPAGTLDAAVSAYSDGRSSCRLIALLSGIFGAAIIGIAYYRSESGRLSQRRLNLIGFVVLAGLLVINGASVQRYSSAAVSEYPAYEAPVDTMLGVLTHAAIKARNAPLATQHLDALPPLRLRDEDGATYLHWTADRGLESAAGVLLSRLVDPNEKDATGLTALHYAVRRGQETLAELLLENGANVDAADTSGVTPLHLAAERAQPGMLTFLLKHGANPNVKDQEGRTPIYNALEAGYTNNVVALVEGGADVNTANAEGVTLLQTTMRLMLNEIDADFDLVALSDFPEFNMVKLLVDRGADVNAKDAQDRTGLHMATALRTNARDGSPAATILDQVIDLLFENDADANLRDANGELAYTLMDAARFGQARWAKQLLHANPDLVNEASPGGKTALQMAVEQGNVEMVTVLLEAGAAIYAWDSSQSSALHHAAAAGSAEIVGLLLEHGFSLEGRYAEVDTPVALAASRGHEEVVSLLLEHDEIGNLSNPRLDHPLIEAAREGQTRIAEQLIEYGVDVRTTGPEGNTPLHEAARAGHLEIVELLLTSGADTASWNNDGKTAYDLARDANQGAIATRLRRAAANR